MSRRVVVLAVCLLTAAACTSAGGPYARLNHLAWQAPVAQPSPSPSPSPSANPVPSPVVAKPVAVNPGPGSGCPNFQLTGFALKQDREGYVLATWSSRGGCGPFHGWLSGTTSSNPGPPNLYVSIASGSGSAEVPIAQQPGFCPHFQIVTVTLALMIQDHIGVTVQPPVTRQVSAQC